MLAFVKGETNFLIASSRNLPERRDYCQTWQAAREHLEGQKRRQVQLCDDVENNKEGFHSEPVEKRSPLVALLTLQNISQCAEAGAAVDMCTGDGVAIWFFSRLLLMSCQLTSKSQHRKSVLHFSFCAMHVCSFENPCVVFDYDTSSQTRCWVMTEWTKRETSALGCKDTFGGIQVKSSSLLSEISFFSFCINKNVTDNVLRMRLCQHGCGLSNPHSKVPPLLSLKLKKK